MEILNFREQGISFIDLTSDVDNQRAVFNLRDHADYSKILHFKQGLDSAKILNEL